MSRRELGGNPALISGRAPIGRGVPDFEPVCGAVHLQRVPVAILSGPIA